MGKEKPLQTTNRRFCPFFLLLDFLGTRYFAPRSSNSFNGSFILSPARAAEGLKQKAGATDLQTWPTERNPLTQATYPVFVHWDFPFGIKSYKHLDRSVVLAPRVQALCFGFSNLYTTGGYALHVLRLWWHWKTCKHCFSYKDRFGLGVSSFEMNHELPTLHVKTSCRDLKGFFVKSLVEASCLAPDREDNQSDWSCPSLSLGLTSEFSSARRILLLGHEQS